MDQPQKIQKSQFKIETDTFTGETIKEFKGIGLNIPENHVHIDTRKKDERSIWIIDENNKELENYLIWVDIFYILRIILQSIDNLSK